MLGAPKQPTATLQGQHGSWKASSQSPNESSSSRSPWLHELETPAHDGSMSPQRYAEHHGAFWQTGLAQQIVGTSWQSVTVQSRQVCVTGSMMRPGAQPPGLQVAPFAAQTGERQHAGFPQSFMLSQGVTGGGGQPLSTTASQSLSCWSPHTSPVGEPEPEHAPQAP